MLNRRAWLAVGILLVVAAASPQAQQLPVRPPTPGARVWLAGENVVRPPDLPEIGKWMIDRSGAPAHWLGAHYQGKKLREPINIVIVDAAAKSPEEAKQRVRAASAAAGYAVRMGHSVGYRGYIGGEVYNQLPAGWDDAFSNGVFELSNNHGRIFGPHQTAEGYVFIAAFSREEVDIFRWPEHAYASFNRARDDFSQHMDRTAPFKRKGRVELKNALVDNPEFTTGDHDGHAVLLYAAE